ncbi:type II toxin-antitoxin system HigB family toxin [Allorhizobium pseudoryzae]|uniref:type II toxin-antitoxin system HigB family toxin n=1 Tax=Allorhizobium pseudoryzae TaxID=379684 RepID=UPI003D092225
MRIIARSTLRHFVENLASRKEQDSVAEALDVWYHLTLKAEWQTSAEVKKTFAAASIVNAERVVFNIKGNHYRLVAAIDYENGLVWIKWIGSHRDCDRIDVTKVQHG